MKQIGGCEHIWGKSVYSGNSDGPFLVCTICGQVKPFAKEEKKS